MDSIYRMEKVADYNNLCGVETLHPLVSLIDFSKLVPTEQHNFQQYSQFYLGFYSVSFKELDCGQILYGRNNYDYQEGTLVFMAPGQVIKIEKQQQQSESKGWALIFHPDLIHGTTLGKAIDDYHFFSYEANEALHVSEQERKIVFEIFSKIAYEIEQRIDKYSKKLIVSNIHLLLDYCARFYNRQFLTREHVNVGTMEKFERLLNDYFHSDKPQTHGIPTVGYFAEKLNLSANYFGDLIKKETGKTALEFIQLKIMDKAKDLILEGTKSVSEIAYDLGFKYPQHFNRIFKNKVGVSPNEYRSLN
ncbi:MAG: helix-turn-helix domain-containing protein [Paludibacter sp.]|nr:helix-turn-helix domain-containing protein [Paludibacter sp.]